MFKKATYKLAIVIHAFYPEILRGILLNLEKMDVTFKLFISTNTSNVSEVNDILKKYNNWEHEVYVVENKGRDVLPFLMILNDVVKQGYEFVLKLHTKKSLHRKDGNEWRDDIYKILCSKKHLPNILRIMDRDPEIGIVGPISCFLNMYDFRGSNDDIIYNLACRMGIEPSTIDYKNENFIAGTMFVARVKALQPILSLSLNSNDFEKESGQIDSTLAHGIERAFTYSSKMAGLKVGGYQTSILGSKILFKQDRLKSDFPFAAKTE